MKKRERQFQTIGVRMRDFGRGIMRHYVPQQQFPAQRDSAPPNWQAETETPLLWEEAPLPAPESAPSDMSGTPVAPAEPTAPPAPKPAPTAPEKPIQRAPAAPPTPPANAPKLPASLLKLVEEGRKRDVQREEIRQDKLAKFSDKMASADAETAAQIRRRRGKMSVSYVDTKPLAQGEEPPIQRQSDAPQPHAEPDAPAPDEDLTEASTEAALETGDDAQQPTDTPGQAPDTPIVDTIQRTASAAESVASALVPSAPSAAEPSDEAQADSSSGHTAGTPIVDTVERVPNEAPPMLPVFVPPSETALTDVASGFPLDVPPARDLSVQRQAEPTSPPLAPPIKPVPGPAPSVPSIIVPPIPPPTAAPSAPTVEARAAQPPVEHQASDPLPASPSLVPPSNPRSTEPPPVPSVPTVPQLTAPDAMVQRTVPLEVEPPTRPDIVLPSSAEQVQRDPINPAVSNSPPVPPAPNSPTVSQGSAPSLDTANSAQPPPPTNTASPAAPLALQRDLPPESVGSNSPAYPAVAPPSAASTRFPEAALADTPISHETEVLVQRETLNQADVLAALPPETASAAVPLPRETKPEPQSSASTTDTLVEVTPAPAVNVQRTILPNSVSSASTTEHFTESPTQPISRADAVSLPTVADTPAVSGSASAAIVQRDALGNSQVISTDKPDTSPAVSAVNTPPSSPEPSTALIAQREYPGTAAQPENAQPEPTPIMSAPVATQAPAALHSDQPNTLPTVSPTTSTPNPVQREPDVVPPQTTPVQSTLEAVLTTQPPLDQPSGLPAVSPTISTPGSVQREVDAAPAQSTPMHPGLETVPPAQSLGDEIPLQTTTNAVSMQREPAPEPEQSEPPLATRGDIQVSPTQPDVPTLAQPDVAAGSPGMQESIAQRELSAPQPDPTSGATPANHVTPTPLPNATEIQAVSPEKSASPDVSNPPIQRESVASEAQSTVEFNATTNESAEPNPHPEQTGDIAPLPVTPPQEAPSIQRVITATEAQSPIEFNELTPELAEPNPHPEQTSDIAPLPVTPSLETPSSQHAITATEAQLPVEFNELAPESAVPSPHAEQTSDITPLPVTPPQEAPPIQRDLFTQPDNLSPVIAAQTITPRVAPATEPPLETLTTQPDPVVQLEQQDRAPVAPTPLTTVTAAPPQSEVELPPIVAAPISEPSSAPVPPQSTQFAMNASSNQSAVQREAAPADNSALPELTPPEPVPSLAAPATEASATAPRLEPSSPASTTEPILQRTPVTPTEAPTETVAAAHSNAIGSAPVSVITTAPIPDASENPQPESSNPASVATPINATAPPADGSLIESSLQREAQLVADTPAPSVTPTTLGSQPLSAIEDEITALPTGLSQPVVSLSPSDVPEQRAPQSIAPSIDPLVTATPPTVSGAQPPDAVQREPAPPTVNQISIPADASVEPHSNPRSSVTTEQSQPISRPEVSTTLIPETRDRTQAAEAAVGESSTSPEPIDVFAALQAAGMVSRTVANVTPDSPPSAEASMESWSADEPDGDTANTKAQPSLPPIDVMSALQAMGLVPSAPPRSDTGAPASIQRSPQPNSPTSAPVIQQEPLTPVLERVITTGDDTETDDAETEIELDDLEIDQLARDVYRILKDRLRIESERARHR